MKKSILILLAFCSMNALMAQENKKGLKATSPVENTTIVDNMYKAFAAGNIPAVLESMDANIVWKEAEGNSYADGNPYIGPEAVLNGVFARVGADHEPF